MFSKHYQNELTFLRGMGQAFGEANPTLAGALTEGGHDPDVQRLFEGFAFLTARIRERLDGCVPEVAHTLTELLLPQYLRAIPSTTIVEFSAQLGALRGRHRIERGVQLASRAVEQTRCLFRTTSAVDLLPLQIENTRIDDPLSAHPQLHVSFFSPTVGHKAVFQPQGVRFFIATEFATGSTLLLWLLRYCVRLDLVGVDGRKIALPPNAVRTVGLDAESALFPVQRFGSEGLRLVQEYFTLPAKFLFFDVVGWDVAQAIAQERFGLVFTFERPPQLATALPRNALRLNCVPVVNLFDVAAEPLRRSPIEEERLLRAASVNPHHMDIYSVNNVVGLRGHERVTYGPLSDFSHAAERSSTSSYYRLRRELSPVDNGVDTYLGMLTPRDVRPSLLDETLSIDLTCTNRFLPSELRVGDICEVTSGSPTIARFSNIAEVTKPLAPPLGAECYWRFVSHVALSRMSLSHPETLQALLSLYNFQGLSEHATGRANRLRIEAIRGVRAKVVRRVLQGAPIAGCRTEIDLDEARFASVGEVFVFGTILDALFASHVGINAFHELQVRMQPSEGTYLWTPRTGQMTII